jgi:ethanolamine utilization cobalamin adenosyltransferase
MFSIHEEEYHYIKNFSKKFYGKAHLGNTDIGGRTILKLNSEN